MAQSAKHIQRDIKYCAYTLLPIIFVPFVATIFWLKNNNNMPTMKFIRTHLNKFPIGHRVLTIYLLSVHFILFFDIGSFTLP